VQPGDLSRWDQSPEDSQRPFSHFATVRAVISGRMPEIHRPHGGKVEEWSDVVQWSCSRDVAVGTWPATQQPPAACVGCSRERAGSRSTGPSKTAGRCPKLPRSTNHMTKCQSYAPGHNVHWIQWKIAADTINAVVIPPPDTQWDLPGIEQEFTLQVNGQPAIVKTFRLHDANRLRSILRNSPVQATYFRRHQLLSVPTGDIADNTSALFYPAFDAIEQCQLTPAYSQATPSLS